MSGLVTSASSAVIDAASIVLQSISSWPEPATGLASRIFTRTGTPPTPLMLQPLRETSATLLRRTPEIAAYGYVLERANAATLTLWTEAIEHLRGREIYPADRQSFIFNPIEILGVSSGLQLPSVPVAHREWLAGTIVRGINQGQFRTPLSQLAAHSALATVDEASARRHSATALDVSTLGTADLMLAAAIFLGFGSSVPGDEIRVEQALMSRALTQTLLINDAAEAATMAILAQAGC